jgi:hypothetical protein
MTQTRPTDPDETAALARVAARYAVAITPVMEALIDTADPHDPIAAQFRPDARELITLTDEDADPIGDAAHSPLEGVVHRYPDRCLLKVVHVCPVYCRYCFRREMVGPQGDGMLSPQALDAALAYIESHPAIWEVILTGGDPLVLSPRRVRELTRRLAAIGHVKVLRWHTRVPVVDPARITPELCAALRSENAATYVVLHSNHARELGAEARGLGRRQSTGRRNTAARLQPHPEVHLRPRARPCRRTRGDSVRHDHGGAGDHEVRHPGTEGQVPARHPRIQRLVVPGLLRAGRRLRPRVAQDQAEDMGDHYLVNGVKTWTTMAQYADMMFCLVRTSQEPQRQLGISFLLIDMKTPGISVNPIITLDDPQAALPGDQHGLPREREGAEGEPGRRAGQGLDVCQVPARVRARQRLLAGAESARWRRSAACRTNRRYGHAAI